MKFILSSWVGFEIDSSEFSAQITSSNPASAISAFFKSSYLEYYVCKDILHGMFRLIDLAKKENKELYQETSFSQMEAKYLQKISVLSRNESKDEELIKLSYYHNLEFIDLCKSVENKLDKTEIIEIVTEINDFLKQFPHLIFELYSSVIEFNIKAYEGITVPFSIVGFPHHFGVSLVDEPAIVDAVQSVQRHASADYDSWM